MKVKNMKVANAQVEFWAKQAVIAKGSPWSQTEFMANCSSIRHCLQKDGATDKQLALFDKLVDEAPTKGGRFNSYSGD